MPRLSEEIESRLLAVARALVDQQAARVIVRPQRDADGYWFGGGNMSLDPQGRLVVVGRYRNAGDSRTGLGAGQRGVELAFFRSEDEGSSFDKFASHQKSDLNVGKRKVLSIEGSAIQWTSNGVELFVSTEKSQIGYPEQLADFQKPETGVWTIEHLRADSVERLNYAEPVTIIQSSDPCHLHVKDPVVYRPTDEADLTLLYCTHPFCWSSSNSSYAVRKWGSSHFGPSNHEFFPRGPAWDVAITRATALVDMPSVGVLADKQVRLLFYDGGESLRNLDEHASAVKRPRGYSCEELGGVAYVVGDDLSRAYRLSQTLPAFISPYGTGASRYVDVLSTEKGLYVTWQQSQDDRSQPLVMNFVDQQRILEML